MEIRFLTGLLLFSCFNFLKATDSETQPRMKFRGPEMKKTLPLQHKPVQIILTEKPETVTAAGQKHLISFNFQFQNSSKTHMEKIQWEKCANSQEDCKFNVAVAQKREKTEQVFVCGTDGRETVCCDTDLSGSGTCRSSEKIRKIKEIINGFPIKEGEPSVLVESNEDALYITHSGSGEFVGIHRFGRHPVGPAKHYKEQHYVGMFASKQKDNQDKVYAFYKEKNDDTGLNSEMWLPFVTRICMADNGGPKNNLQFTWTSQINAKLFCGDQSSRQHFSELVDVSTVHADDWQDTRVYALFRNEWGMSAVCVYTMRDIDTVFTSSPFKGGDMQTRRSRTCTSESTAISVDVLSMIKKNSELQRWVQPVNSSGPLLFNHHHYTHIYVDGLQRRRNNNHPVLFLSMHNGGIHKVMQNEGQTFIIAEYHPLNNSSPIHSIALHPSSKKLYVSSSSELVQLDVGNCAQYGQTCQECVLARDPYCGWNGTHCIPDGKQQDVAGGNHERCLSPSKLRSPRGESYHAEEDAGAISVPSQSKYFLQCPVSSHHAQYTWKHPEGPTSCSSKESECLLLIGNMGPEQAGTYTCESEEMGYKRVIAQYQLQLGNGSAGRSSSPLVWICLTALLIASFNF